MLVKFEQICVVQTTWNFELFDKKSVLKPFLTWAMTPFWKTFLKLKQLIYAKLLIWRLPSFSASKITEVRHV